MPPSLPTARSPDRPEAAVHLGATLKRVAPVDEDRGLSLQHHGRSRRSFKAGQPCEPLRIFADILAHMLIGQRHDKAAQLPGLQFVAQRAQPRFMGRHRRNLLRSLTLDRPSAAWFPSTELLLVHPSPTAARGTPPAQLHPPRHHRQRRLRLAARSRLSEGGGRGRRSEEHTSELQSLMRISYAVFCLKKKT